jgi:hypothetical protein
MSVQYFQHQEGVSPLSSLRIGTRTDAGWYCLKCRRTLCRGGEPAIHQPAPEWFDECPGCGTEPNEPDGSVRWVSSFTWDVAPGSVDGGVLEQLAKAGAGFAVRAVAEDDDGTLLTYEQFTAAVADCPIIFRNP